MNSLQDARQTGSGTHPVFASDADALVAVIIGIALLVAVLDVVRDRWNRDRLKIRRRH